MSASPRDVIKTRAQRIGEVYSQLHLKNGQADSQLVSFGGDLGVGTTNTRFKVNDTELVLGQAIVNKTAEDNIVVDATASTAAGQFRKVLVEANASGTISQKVGAIASAQADAVLPKGDTDKVSVGWIEVPASFTPGTTAVTAAMLKKMPYWT